MANLNYLTIPEVTLPSIGILGLLLIWQYYRNKVMAGRIYAVDFWDLLGVRMFMLAASWDGQACPSCQEANGTVFLPSLVTKKNFTLLPHLCSNPMGCRCLVVGLYGGWPEADRLVLRLREHAKNKPLKLTEWEFKEFLDGPWEHNIRGAADRFSMEMLKALYCESKDLEEAIVHCRRVVGWAKGARDLRLVVPAFLHLVELLERIGRHEEALAVVDRFELRFPPNRSAFYYPSGAQRKAMLSRKLRIRSLPTESPGADQNDQNLVVAQQEVSPQPSPLGASSLQ